MTLLFAPLLFLYLLLCSWNIDVREYADPAASPYALPVKRNSKTFCIQGNKTICTHKEKFEYSFDFLLPLGTEVVAARDGIVTEVLNSVMGIGNFKGNFVAVFNSEDKTTAIYAHLKYKGAVVNEGDTIHQGQLIGYSGCTGRSLYPHLHFHVEKAGRSIPVSFNNINKDQGVPRFLHTYTSN